MDRGTPTVPQFTEVVAKQFTVADSAAALSSTPLGGSGLACLQADSENSGTIKLGDANGQFVALAAGDWFPFLVPISNLSLIVAIGSEAGQLLNAIIFQ